MGSVGRPPVPAPMANRSTAFAGTATSKDTRNGSGVLNVDLRTRLPQYFQDNELISFLG